MSQAAVEQVLGRLLTDSEFREAFFSGPAGSILQMYPLTEAEWSALWHSRNALRKKDFERQGLSLDPSICRAPLRPLRSVTAPGG
jgi:hypothetical protein